MLGTHESLKRYADEISRLVAFAIRTTKGQTETDYRLPLSDIAQRDVMELEAALRTDADPEECMELLHLFLMHSIAAINKNTYEDSWQDVLTCWIAVRAIKWPTVFIEPSDYTPLIAKFQYNLRCIYFYDAYLHRREYPALLLEYVFISLLLFYP